MDHISVPLGQIQASLELLRRGVVDHEICEPEDLDQAVALLAEAHDQVGGLTRQSLYAVFAASRGADHGTKLADELMALCERLGCSNYAQADQLTLFDGTGESDATLPSAIRT